MRTRSGPPSSRVRHRRTGLRTLAVVLIALGLALMLVGGSRAEQDGAVHVVRIEGEIDLGLAPFLDRVVTAADESAATAIVVEIDTPGGRLDAVLQMRDTLLEAATPTIAYVDRTAFSAGALVALASEEIHFAPGGVMGAATPVIGGAGETADAKVIAAVRSVFRSTAEERGRDTRIAEAMVDDAIEIDGVVASGELLSLSASEADRVGYSDGLARDRDELLAAAGLEGLPLVEHRPALAEQVVRFVTNPVLASLLVMGGVLLVIGDLLAGGVGVGSAAGLGMLGMFFYGHRLAGLAGWEDLALILLGVVLLLVELLVVPGFGVPGVLGLASVLGGAYLAMLGRDWDLVSSERMIATATTVGLAFIGITIGLVALLALLGRRLGGPTRPGQPASASSLEPRRPRGWLRWFGDGDVLEREDVVVPGEEPEQPRADPRGSVARPGAVGIALTDLRPAGVANFDGHRVDVVTEGDYLEAGAHVEVLHTERYRCVVHRAPDPHHAGPPAT